MVELATFGVCVCVCVCMQLAGEGERRRESLARERMNQLAEKSRNSLTSGLLVRPVGGRGVYIIYILLL